MTQRSTRALIAVGVTMALTAACSSGLDAAGKTVMAAPKVSQGTKPVQPKNQDPNKDARPYADTLQASVVDIQEFWSKEMPKAYDRQYVAIPTSRMFPYDRSHLPPACGGQQVSYEELAGNAFYCSEGDFIAWDDGELLPELYSEFGPFSIAMVLAHEWGHAIQDQVGLTDQNLATVVLEQQADCFAGAWTRHVADGDSTHLSLGEGSLDAALGGMLKFRDEPGLVGAGDPGAHGSGFDRVRAFQDGYTGGVSKCTKYPDQNLKVFEFPFSEDEYRTGGNLPLKDFLDPTVVDLNEYFAQQFPSFKRVSGVVAFSGSDSEVSCGSDTRDVSSLKVAAFYCAADNKVYYNDDKFNEVHDAIGDYSVGVLLGLQWATSAQLQAKQPASELDTEKAATQRLCLVGAWTGTFVKDRETGQTSVPKREISISGGDLDEAVSTIIAFTDKQSKSGELTFGHINAFQNGVLNGESSCDFSL